MTVSDAKDVKYARRATKKIKKKVKGSISMGRDTLKRTTPSTTGSGAALGPGTYDFTPRGVDLGRVVKWAKPKPSKKQAMANIGPGAYNVSYSSFGCKKTFSNRQGTFGSTGRNDAYTGYANSLARSSNTRWAAKKRSTSSQRSSLRIKSARSSLRIKSATSSVRKTAGKTVSKRKVSKKKHTLKRSRSTPTAPPAHAPTPSSCRKTSKQLEVVHEETETEPKVTKQLSLGSAESFEGSDTESSQISI